jgi:DNA-directed RNA polymerase subunit E'/Rpb7
MLLYNKYLQKVAKIQNQYINSISLLIYIYNLLRLQLRHLLYFRNSIVQEVNFHNL